MDPSRNTNLLKRRIETILVAFEEIMGANNYYHTAGERRAAKATAARQTDKDTLEERKWGLFREGEKFHSRKTI